MSENIEINKEILKFIKEKNFKHLTNQQLGIIAKQVLEFKSEEIVEPLNSCIDTYGNKEELFLEIMKEATRRFSYLSKRLF